MTHAANVIECIKRIYSACCIVYFLGTIKVDDSGYLWWITPFVLGLQMAGYFFVGYLFLTAMEVWDE